VRISGIGIVAGLAAVVFLVRRVQDLLFGVPEYDPLVFVLAPVLIFLVAIVASALPARYAARADPLVSLCAE